jgi:hypothetical protein
MFIIVKQEQWVAQILWNIEYLEYIALNSVTVKTRRDNQGALVLVKNPHLYEYLKHIDVAHHYICDL